MSVSGTQASTVGQLNPFRYRGYCYDEESGFYYLNSRYYDPEVGRFISSDSVLGAGAIVNGCNLYTYCMNNPINMIDPTGNWPKWCDDIANVVKKSVKEVVNAPLRL